MLTFIKIILIGNKNHNFTKLNRVDVYRVVMHITIFNF